MLAEAYLTTANKESVGQIMKCVILQAIFADSEINLPMSGICGSC